MRFATRHPISKDLAQRVFQSLSATDSFVMVNVDPSGLEMEVYGALTLQQAQASIEAAGCEACPVDLPLAS